MRIGVAEGGRGINKEESNQIKIFPNCVRFYKLK